MRTIIAIEYSKIKRLKIIKINIVDRILKKLGVKVLRSSAQQIYVLRMYICI